MNGLFKDKLLKKTTAVAPIDLVPEEDVVDKDRVLSTSIVFPQAEVGAFSLSRSHFQQSDSRVLLLKSNFATTLVILYV